MYRANFDEHISLKIMLLTQISIPFLEEVLKLTEEAELSGGSVGLKTKIHQYDCIYHTDIC